jgi:YidC/Oxa1 family membrane protein insertase
MRVAALLVRARGATLARRRIDLARLSLRCLTTSADPPSISFDVAVDAASIKEDPENLLGVFPPALPSLPLPSAVLMDASVPASDFSGGIESTAAAAANSAQAAVVHAAVDVAAALPLVLSYWPPDLALRAAALLHDSAGLPWWGAIVACTLTVRVALLPIALRGTQQQAALQGLRADLQPLQARIQASGGTDAAAVEELRALYARHGVSPFNVMLLPLAQLPIFMSFFLGLRRLADAFPTAHEGGMYWFVDLGARDESFYLPVASGLTALALVRLSIPGAPAGASADEAQQVERMKLMMSGLTMISLPVASTMPNSVLLFWIANNTFSLGYVGLLQMDAVRAALGLPPRAPFYTSSATPPVPNTESHNYGGLMGSGGAAPVDKASMGRAQRRTADSLAALAQSMRVTGKLEEAISMQQRALSLCTDSQGEADVTSLAMAFELAKMQHFAGQRAEATQTLERWRRATVLAGGNEAEAAQRCEALLGQRPSGIGPSAQG